MHDHQYGAPSSFIGNLCPGFLAVYRFQQVSSIVHRHSKQQQQQQGAEDQDEEEAQSVEMWLLTDSTMAQLMDPQLAAPAVQFLVLEVPSHAPVLLANRNRHCSYC